MEYQIYIKQKKEIYEDFYQFISDENSCQENNDDDFKKLVKKIKEQKIQEDEKELKIFLRLILKVSNHHYRYPNFINKIYKILEFLSQSIKQTFSNLEIFQIFESNQKILLYFIENKIITIDAEITKEIIYRSIGRNKNYKYFFYPEIKEFIPHIEKEQIEKIMNEHNENFDEKRQKGENDWIVCEMIRNDSVEEFCAYVNKTNLSLSTQIRESIFETNLLLNEKQPTLIEYAAFYGSLQIVKYMWFNRADAKSSLWIYGIHSNNPELIHFLEENHVEPPNSFNDCLLQSIECHHNEISNYIRDQLLINEPEKDYQEKQIEKIIESMNFREMQEEISNKFMFFYLCYNGFSRLVDLYIKPKLDNIENKMIKKQFFF